MAREHILYYSLNRGEVSSLMLARTDLEHLRMAARRQVNWLPRVLGPMMLRPGTQAIGEINQDLPAKMIPFVAGFNDKALVELTAGTMQVWVSDTLVTRAAVSTVLPAFSAWVLTQTGTATAVITAGSIIFSSVNNGSVANANTSASIAAQDQMKEHAVRITISQGPVTFRIGTSPQGEDLQPIITLDVGTYSIAFVPGTGVPTVYFQFSTIISAENANTLTNSIPQGLQQTIVASCSIEPPGVMQLPTPWPQSALVEVANNVIVGPSSIRYTESADVIYIACDGIPQYQINRYGQTSWSVVKYRPVKGPMPGGRGDPSVLLAPSSLTGNIALTANKPFFDKADVGTLFRLFQNGQHLTQSLTASDTYTDAIRVTGVCITTTIVSGSPVNAAAADRNYTFTLSGTWVGTVSLERSFEGPNSGFTVVATATSNATTTNTDGINNVIVWYRLGFGPGAYVSGTLVVTLSYAGGGGAGVCHVTGFNSSTSVSAEVLVPFFNTSNASDWRQSEWSTSQGFPSAVELHGGRLWWAGSDRWWGSVSDDYNNFDYDAIGDASPVDESIGKGPIANMNWLLSLDHLLGGADTSIIMARSDAIDSTVTATTFNLRQPSTNGSYPIQAVRVDARAIYVDQSGRRLYELIYDIQNYNYKPSDLTRLNPDIGLLGFLDMSVQRQPDTRINLVRKDGQVVSLIYDVEDDVLAFWRVQTDGIIESVTTLPGPIEDQVYYVVRRTINGVDKRYLEKLARIDECQGGLITKCIDSHRIYQGPPATSLPAFLPHLVGKTAVIWADGKDIGTCVVNSAGDISWPADGGAYQNVVAGLPYTAEFLSAKLAYAAKQGSAINKNKRIDHIGFVLENTHCKGIRYGQLQENPIVVNPLFPVNNELWDDDKPLDDLPDIERGVEIDENTIWAAYDEKVMEFAGDDEPDARLYIQAASPRPATIVGLTFDIETSG